MTSHEKGILDQIFSRLIREIDFVYPDEWLFLIFLSILISETLIVFLWFKARRQLKSMAMLGGGTASTSSQGTSRSRFFLLSFVALGLSSFGGLLNYGYRFFIAKNESAIFVGNTNIFYASGAALFVIMFSIYVRHLINLSRHVQRWYVISDVIVGVLGSVIVITMILLVIIGLPGRIVNILFFILAIVYTGILISLVIFSAIDLKRVASKLMKVRLTLVTLAALFMLFQGFAVAFYFFLTVSQGFLSQFIPIIVFILYSVPIFVAILLYWSYFIPFKIQEWAGILPPSFKLLKRKRELLAAKRTK